MLKAAGGQGLGQISGFTWSEIASEETLFGAYELPVFQKSFQGLAESAAEAAASGCPDYEAHPSPTFDHAVLPQRAIYLLLSRPIGSDEWSMHQYILFDTAWIYRRPGGSFSCYNSCGWDW